MLARSGAGLPVRGFSAVTLALGLVGHLAVGPALEDATLVSESGLVETTDVSFEGGDGVQLQGTVVVPTGHQELLPGLVMVSGAGPVTRDELRAEAEAYAQRGVVTLIYDKRTVGYSMLQRDYELLALDALAGVRFLRSRPDVDPELVGVWGLSEGAWVAPIAAARSSEVAFVIVVGAVGVSPARQQAWAYGEFLRHAGVSGSLLPTMQETATRTLVDTGLFTQANYDPVPVWEQVSQPTLAVWGTLDREAVPGESAQIIRRALDSGGNAHYMIRFVPGVRHNLNLTTDGGFDRIAEIPDSYARLEASWINGLADGPPPVSVQAAPHQARSSSPVTPLAWYESGWLQLAAGALFLCGFGGYFVAGVFLRRHRSPVRRTARTLAATGLVAFLGGIGYLGFLVVTATNVIGPVVLGRPIPWLALHALALAVVAATVVTAVALRRYYHRVTLADRVRLGVLLTAGVAFIPWALHWGLLQP